jgi:hypothetical protein
MLMCIYYLPMSNNMCIYGNVHMWDDRCRDDKLPVYGACAMDDGDAWTKAADDNGRILAGNSIRGSQVYITTAFECFMDI